MFALLSRWFEPADALQRDQRSDYLVLSAILIAGAILRFWGLANVGLHGDEETMAMPAMSVLETGQPLLPSGMYYARALLNIYLMSGSAWLFGESEWAFRFPSAVVGSLTGLAAFFMGRRFLSPHYNLAFVATICFLPGMIEISQTARMYVFFVTCVIWFAACLFRWERDQRITSLFLALVVWALCLHFHRLAIIVALLFVFPGLSRRSYAQLTQGACALLVSGLVYFFYNEWIGGKYPQGIDRPALPDPVTSITPLDFLASNNGWLLTGSLIGILTVTAILLRLSIRLVGWSGSVPLILAGLAISAMAVLHYHVGGIILIIAVVFWLREKELPRSWLFVVLMIAAVMAVAHLLVLQGSGMYPGRKLMGALVGAPSIWPTFRFLEYSPTAGILYGAVIVFALSVFANGGRLPIHFLFFMLAVWFPLLVLGAFAWNMPPRYAQGQLGLFLMCVYAGMAYIFAKRNWINVDSNRPRGAGLLMWLIAAIIVNPAAAISAANPSYESYPDHKGAAEYIRSLDLDSGAVLIAEDVLQQTYYLGHVDYSLRPVSDAVYFSIIRDDTLVDQYTGAPVIGTGSELEKILDENRNFDIYIIGSGENFVNGMRMFRGEGISDVLASDRVEVVFEGRDNKTLVWKARSR